VPVTLSAAPEGLYQYNVTVSLNSTSSATISGATNGTMPDEVSIAGQTGNSFQVRSQSQSSITFRQVDLNDNVPTGTNSQVVLGYVLVDTTGTEGDVNADLTVHTLQNDTQDPIPNNADAGTLSVNAPPQKQVDVQPGTLSPNAVDENQTVTHDLSYTVNNVSGDGNTDTFQITLPAAASFAQLNSLAVSDEAGNSVAITGSPSLSNANGGTNNQVSFDVSPSGDINATVDANVDVSFPEVQSDTTAPISASVTDSSYGSDTTDVASVTIRDVPEDTTGGIDTASGSINGQNQLAVVENSSSSDSLSFTLTDVTADGTANPVSVTFGSLVSVSNVQVSAQDPQGNSVPASVTSSTSGSADLSVNPSGGGTTDVAVTVTYDSQFGDVPGGGDVISDVRVGFAGQSSTIASYVIEARATAGTFVSAEVTDTAGNFITTSGTGITVDFIDVGTGNVVESNVTLNQFGQTRRINVQAGRDYRAQVNIPPGQQQRFSTASGVEGVTAGETKEIDVTVQRLLVPTDITVVDVEPPSASAIANGSDEITYTVQVNDTTTAGGPTPVPGEPVTVTLQNTPFPANVTFADPAQQNTTNQNGIAQFTVTSDRVQQADLLFASLTDPSVNTTATANFQALRGNKFITGDVLDNESNAVPGATVWAAYQGQNQTLEFAQDNQPYLVDQADAEGEYVLEGLRSNETVNLYVLADGFNRLNRTSQSVGAFVAADEMETTPDDMGPASENHDFALVPGGPAVEYRLDVTLDNPSDAASSTVSPKDATIPQDETIEATVTVEQRQAGSSLAYTPAPGVDVSVNATAPGILDPDTTDTTTDANGQVVVTFTGEFPGVSNVSASTVNSAGTRYNSSGAEQARVTVFGTGEITGQVTNEQQQQLADGQATVTLQRIFANGTRADLRSTEIDANGRYVFSNVRTGLDYRLVAAETGTQRTGTATVLGIPPGTTTADIVIRGATPGAPDIQVSTLSAPGAASVGDTITVNATVANVGNADAPDQTVEFRLDIDQDGTLETVASQTVDVGAGANVPVSFQVTVPGLANGTYTHGVFVGGEGQTATIAISGNSGSPPPVVGTSPPTNTDGDAALEDVNGDGTLSVTDVQALFANLDSDAVQDNPSAFDYNGDGSVSVSDVQALFVEATA
jgi:hypothetical protein